MGEGGEVLTALVNQSGTRRLVVRSVPDPHPSFTLKTEELVIAIVRETTSAVAFLVQRF